MIKCMIVDDEPIARRVLQSHLEKMEGVEVVGECADALEAREELCRCHVDVLFLDIQMPEESGIDLARTLGERPHVIFTTARRDALPEDAGLGEAEILRKPIGPSRLARALERYRQ